MEEVVESQSGFFPLFFWDHFGDEVRKSELAGAPAT
jgi:hypothetical protein